MGNYNHMGVLFFIASLCVCVAGRGSYTNFVNQEKLYTLEDELIALSDVIVNQERINHGDDDVHDLYTIDSVVEKTKGIHREVVNSKNMSDYISHPLNIYHMTKRLVDDWSDVIKRLKESKSCAKAMLVKVQNIEDNIPTESKLTEVCESILRLQSIHNVSAGDVIYWNISGSLPLSPLTLDDAFKIAQIAYESKRYHLCLDWLDHITANFDTEETMYNITNVLNLLSSTNFMIGRPHEAISNLDKILEIDPANNVAIRNRAYIKERVKDGQTDKSIVSTQPRTKRDRDINRMCSQHFTQNSTRRFQPFCTYTKDRNAGYFVKPRIQTEVFSLNPTIMLFLNMTNTSQQKAVRYLGYERMRDRLSKYIYKYPDGIESTWILDTTRWQWIPNLQKSLEAIAVSKLSPDPSVFMIQNIGIDGYELQRSKKKDKYELGTFIVFLNDIRFGGGEVIFPDTDIKVKPEKGSVLFFDVKAKRKATVCPTLADASWMATYSLMDKMATNVCHRSPILKPTYR